jgi:hypothetical protein
MARDVDARCSLSTEDIWHALMAAHAVLTLLIACGDCILAAQHAAGHHCLPYVAFIPA